MRALQYVAAAFLLWSLAGCGGPPPPPKPSGPPYAKANFTSKITGVVKFEGTPPEREPVDMGGDRTCLVYHKSAPLTESVLVTEGKLQNVVIYIKQGAEKWSYPTPTTAAVMDQFGCSYSPHVLDVQSDQGVIFKNSDDISHNVHAVSPSHRNSDFNLPQYKQGTQNEMKFASPELAVRIQCDIHKWMIGYVAIFDHPFHAVTNEKGEFTIDAVPPGEYELEAWHEQCGGKLDGPHSMKITVKDKESATADFTFAMRK